MDVLVVQLVVEVETFHAVGGLGSVAPVAALLVARSTLLLRRRGVMRGGGASGDAGLGAPGAGVEDTEVGARPAIVGTDRLAA